MDCDEAEVNGGQICHPLNEPHILDQAGVCPDCKHNETAEEEAEMKRVMEESMRLHQEHKAKNEQSQEQYEEAMRAALDASANTRQPAPPLPVAEQTRWAMQESMAAARAKASTKKLYYKQAFKYLGCGCTKMACTLPIERNTEDPEALVEETYGRCPDHDGEGSSTPPKMPISQPLVDIKAPIDYPEDIPPQAYEYPSPPPQFEGKGKGIIGSRFNDPMPAMAGSSMPGPPPPVHDPGQMRLKPVADASLPRVPSDEGWMAPPPAPARPSSFRGPTVQDEEDEDELYEAFNKLSTKPKNSGPSANLPPPPQTDEKEQAQISASNPADKKHPQHDEDDDDDDDDDDDFESGPDDSDFESEDEDPSQPARRAVTVSTMATINSGGLNKPHLMGGALDALEEDDEEDDDLPPMGRGGRR